MATLSNMAMLDNTTMIKRIAGWVMRAADLGYSTVLGKPLPYGRGTVIVALTSQGLTSRDRKGAVSSNQNLQNG